MTSVNTTQPFKVTLKTDNSYHITQSQKFLETNKSEATLLNLDNYFKSSEKNNFNGEYYAKFKAFQKGVFSQLADEVDKNEGEIIQKHIYDNKYKKDIEEIFERYKTTYIDSISLTEPDIHMKTSDEKQYPLFQEDLYNKSSLPYENFEENVGIRTKIENQSDEEFFNTLGKRVEGLNQCSIDDRYNKTESKPLKEYFENEKKREEINYEQIIKKLNTTEELKEDIKEDINKHCKLIEFSPKKLRNITMLNNNVELEKIMKAIKKLFENNKVEYEYAKTFLSEEFWIDGILNYDSIKKQIKAKDYVQYIYGFSTNENFKYLYNLELPLYITISILPSTKNHPFSCHPLVVWNILLNMIVSKCATYNNNPLCFLRLYLPVLNTLINRVNFKDTLSDIPNPKNKKQEIYEIQSHKKLLDLFDGDSKVNSEFIGIITIKYIYNKTKFLKSHELEYRIWYLYVFKNNDNKKDNRNRLNTLTGINENFFCVSQELYYINKGSLFKKDNTTYYELLFFINLCKKNNIYIYKTKYNPTLVFLSLYDNLEENQFLSELQMTKVELNVFPYINKKIYLTLEYNNIVKGGANKSMYKLSFTNNEKQLYLKNIISDYVLKSNLLRNKVFNLSFYSNDINKYYISSERELFKNTQIYLYDFLLINYDESLMKHKFNNKTLNLTKYKPIGLNFYHINELFNKYNIFKNFNYNNDSILSIGTNLSFIEVIKFNNYKVKNIKNILTIKQNVYSLYDLEKWNHYIKNISNIYNIENIEFNDSIYNLINFNFINKNTNYYKIIYYSVVSFYRNIELYENYYNIPCRFASILFMLKNLKIGGTFILNINYLDYKFEADMIIIISKYFEKYNLFKPEIHNELKRSGIMTIFENFKGIDENDNTNKNDYSKLLKILDTIKTLYPNEGKDFNIYDKSIREDLHITKPIISIPKTIPKQIISFLDTNINDKIYDKIKEFTEEINFKKCLFIQKMINILSSPEQIDIMNKTKLPTPDQIMSSIMYCRKYNIPFNDKYNEDKLSDLTNKTILDDMYGLSNPILGKFKTPFQTYIVNKIILNPKLKYKSKSKSRKKANSLPIFKTKSIILNSKLKPTFKSKSIKLKTKNNSNSFFNNLFKLSIKKSKKSKSIKSTSQKSITQKKSLFKHNNNISLDKALFNSNNSIKQAYLTIDSRKDFTKANPNEDYDNFKEEFRYYRSKGKDKSHNLNLTVQRILDDKSISQAWLKMYEIISECNIVPLNKNGVFKSFHFCEAPGTFINCLNNYIYTKTNFTQFEWLAQSLHPRLAKIKDAYGIIKRHPNNWDWGIDKTGDITNPENIKYYAKLIKLFNMENRNKIDTKQYSNIPFLITADAGLEPEDPKYKLVAYSSYVAILYSLPIHGMMVYKIKDIPLELPLIWNLIYITYTNFKEMYFFKPVQNSQSSEFYIIAKDYLGTINTDIFDYLMKQIDKFDKKTYEPPTIDLFDNMYPEEFIVQLSSIYDKIARNHIHSIERIIYYVDNKDLIGNDYKKHIKDYILEKNEEWLKKYKVKRLAKNKIL